MQHLSGELTLPSWFYEMAAIHWDPTSESIRYIDNKVILKRWQNFETTLYEDSKDIMRLIDEKYSRTLNVRRLSWDSSHRLWPREAYPGCQGMAVQARVEYGGGDLTFLNIASGLM